MLGCLSRIRGLSAFEGWKKAASAGRDYKVSMVGGQGGGGGWRARSGKREFRFEHVYIPRLDSKLTSKPTSTTSMPSRSFFPAGATDYVGTT